MLRVGLACLTAAVLVSHGRGQEDRSFERLSLRVSAKASGSSVVVDRGHSDLVKVGDRVLFYPLRGGTQRGKVVRVEDRRATVQLFDKSIDLPRGTRGEVLIPKARFQTPKQPEQRTGEPDKREPKQDEKPTSEHPPWRNRDENFKPGHPLLDDVRPVRPEQRAMRTTGRFFTGIDLRYNTIEDSLSNSLVRAGTDLVIDNPFGRGGDVRIDAEFNYKEEQNDISGLDLLVRTLSYSWGGTRFDRSRWEVGRFLHRGFAEFGVLDGVEWNYRTNDGQRFGASIGFLPEPDDDFKSLQDLSLAAHYQWVSDDREQWTIGAGFQKTFHNGKSDRDLLVLKANYLPLDGWDFHSTVWVDFYTPKDVEKGAGTEVTQALANLGHHWDTGNGFDLSYRRLRWPEMLRTEFLPLDPGQLATNRYDRLTLSAWRWLGDASRLHGYVAGFDDQRETGGAAELGLEVHKLFGEDTQTDITGYGTNGEFTTVIGARLNHSSIFDSGRWDLLYDVSVRHFESYPDDGNDLIQHRARLTRDFFSNSGWNLSLYAEAGLWDKDFSGSLGVYYQMSF